MRKKITFEIVNALRLQASQLRETGPLFVFVFWHSSLSWRREPGFIRQ
jgi:hypothetical protein